MADFKYRSFLCSGHIRDDGHVQRAKSGHRLSCPVCLVHGGEHDLIAEDGAAGVAPVGDSPRWLMAVYALGGGQR